MTLDEGTIAALATPPGEGPIAIVRISGPKVLEILNKCFRPANQQVVERGRLTYGHVIDEDGAILDEVMAVYLPAPHTYTREDVAEIQGHGGRAVAERVLKRVFGLGARAALPGEFTKRAFLNGRIGLSEAEAVMALIASDSESAARAAIRQLGGGVSRVIDGLSGQLTALLGLIEASDDFPEEIEEQATRQDVLLGLEQVTRELRAAVDPRAAHLISDGASVVLVGRPNTGKSSLLNALTASDRAIVTSAPGTTRDLLTARMRIGGLDITLTDTAGQRDAQSEAEQIGVERAKNAQQQADVVLCVLDGATPMTQEDEKLLLATNKRFLILVNKCDLPIKIHLPDGVAAFFVSAATGDGLKEVKEAIALKLGNPAARADLLTTQRHIDLANRALSALDRAREGLCAGDPVDLNAIELEEALASLLEITGKNAAEEVISHVFSSFCVGK